MAANKQAEEYEAKAAEAERKAGAAPVPEVHREWEAIGRLYRTMADTLRRSLN